MKKYNTLVNRVESIWKEITDSDSITDIVDQSERKIQIIYKHSHRCGVCLIAKEEMEKLPEEFVKDVDLYLVNVIQERSISDAITHQLEIRHESPQIIILKGGVVKWKGSHWDVTAANAEKYLT